MSYRIPKKLGTSGEVMSSPTNAGDVGLILIQELSDRTYLMGLKTNKQTQNQQRCCNIVTNSIKSLKCSTSKILKKKKNTRSEERKRRFSFPRFSGGVIFLMHTSAFFSLSFYLTSLNGSEAMTGNLQRISRHSGLSNERPSTSYFCPQKAYPSALFHAQRFPFW